MWHKISDVPPPEKKEILTKIVDADGTEHNEQKLKKSGKLWWQPDMSMYVYFTPTHWKYI